MAYPSTRTLGQVQEGIQPPSALHRHPRALVVVGGLVQRPLALGDHRGRRQVTADVDRGAYAVHYQPKHASIRRLFPGEHRVEVLANGETVAEGGFALVAG
jgi:hypothetical protein